MNEKDHEEFRLDTSTLRREMQPPDHLEQRIIVELKREGLLSSRPLWPLVAAAIAACLACFVAGFLYHKSSDGSGVSMSENTYVLFLFEDSSYQIPASDQELYKRIQEYGDWARDLRSSGIPVSGTKLQDERRLVGFEREDLAIAGYFLIDAKSMEEAVDIARRCPHITYGGKIEVRRIHPV